MLYLRLLIPIALYFTATRSAFVSHTYNLPTQTSDASNIVTVDILDDTAYDMRYQTDCADCKCFIQSPVLTPEKQTDISFTNPIVFSQISEGRLFILHRAETTQEYSYSVYEVSPPSSLNEIIKEKAIEGLSGEQFVSFSAKDRTFLTFDSKLMLLAIMDDQGIIVQATPYQYPNKPLTDPYLDMVYDASTYKVFLANGDEGLDIVYPDENPEVIKVPLEELDLEESFLVNKLAMDADNKIVYLYYPHSNYSTIAAVQYTAASGAQLIGKYDLGINQIIQILVSARKFYVVHHVNGKHNYVEFLRDPENVYAQPKMIKVWEVPHHIKNFQLNDDNILIDTPDYLYVIKDDTPFETENSQLLVDVIKKEANGTQSIFQGSSLYVLTAENLQLNLYSAPFETPLLKCGIYKEGDYAGTVSFKVDIYRDSCTDAPTKSENNTCLDHYTFDADFTGNTFTPFDTDLFAHGLTPLSTPTSNNTTPPEEVPETPENSTTQPGTNEPGTGGENTGTGTETGTETPETPTNNTTGEHGGHGEPVTGPGETPEGPGEETPETPTNTTNPNKPPEDTNEPTDPNNTSQTNGTNSGDGGLIKKPDLIDPDAPYLDKITSTYMLVVVGIIVLTCFGCLGKCLYDFVTRSQRQWQHKELEEDEEEGQDQDPGSQQNMGSKGTDDESSGQY